MSPGMVAFGWRYPFVGKKAVFSCDQTLRFSTSCLLCQFISNNILIANHKYGRWSLTGGAFSVEDGSMADDTTNGWA